ncbi:MAG: hypothetical protein QG608_1023 [Actinomycetota bacterium]|nr:hypothetical protein [Actinomycetota bacterium]
MEWVAGGRIEALRDRETHPQFDDQQLISQLRSIFASKIMPSVQALSMQSCLMLTTPVAKEYLFFTYTLQASHSLSCGLRKDYGYPQGW